MTSTATAALTAGSPSAAKSTKPKQTDIEAAFAAFQAHIAAVQQPHEPQYRADAGDLSDWADHLESVMEATRQYVRATLAGLRHVTPTAIDAGTVGLDDAIGDIVGGLRKARNRVEQEAA